MNIVCVVGSLRSTSFNRALFNTVKALAPDGVSITEGSIAELPLYNADNETPLPAPVVAFKESLESADGIILISPEYNRSIPGVLKNAIDWGSRPSKSSSWYQKPVAVMGATPGSLGTSAMQLHLKGVLAHMGTDLMGFPEFFMSNANEKVNEEGDRVVDSYTQEKITSFLEAFIAHIQKN